MSKIDEKAFSKYVKPKEFEELDLVFLTGEHIKANISESAGNRFLSDPAIKDVSKLNSTAQRVIINRYFTNLLLKFRANNDVNITEILVLLVNDGYDTDWFKLFNLIIAPFFKEHNILGI